jgi:hypothetical protein
VTSGRHLDRSGSRHDDAAIGLRWEDGVALDDDPFTWTATKDGRVLVFRAGRRVAIVAGAQAERLRPRLARGPDEAQHALARATGNYRRGNEGRMTTR